MTECKCMFGVLVCGECGGDINIQGMRGRIAELEQDNSNLSYEVNKQTRHVANMNGALRDLLGLIEKHGAKHIRAHAKQIMGILSKLEE